MWSKRSERNNRLLTVTAFPLKCGSLAARANGAEGVRESVAIDAVAATDTVSQRRVAIEVAGLAVWAKALPETKLTDEQVPLSYRPSHT